MARLFTESFDLMTPSQWGQTQRYASVGSGVVQVAGRNGLGVSGTAGATDAQNTLRSVNFTPHLGRAGFQGFAITPLSAPSADRDLWRLLDSAGASRLTLVLQPDLTLALYAGDSTSGTLLGQSAVAMATVGAYVYLDIGWTLGTAARVEVRSIPADGSEAQLFLPATTSLAGTWAAFELVLTDLIAIDDLYVNDTALALRGVYFDGDTDVLVGTVTADAGGFTWLPAASAALVAETPHDGDASFVYLRPPYPGRRLWQIDLPDHDGAVSAVQVTAIARALSSPMSSIPALYFLWGTAAFNYAAVGLTLGPYTGLRGSTVLPTKWRAYMTADMSGASYPGYIDWTTVAGVEGIEFGVAGGF